MNSVHLRAAGQPLHSYGSESEVHGLPLDRYELQLSAAGQHPLALHKCSEINRSILILDAELE